MEPLHAVEDPPTNGPEQDQRMRAVLVQLEILTYGGTYQYEGPTARQKPLGGDTPAKRWGADQDEEEPLHILWRYRYVLAKPENREQVISDATDALIKARKRTEPIPDGESEEEWEARVINEGRDLSAKEAAVKFRTGTSTIVRVRRKMNCDPNTGHELAGELSARVLAERGMTACQIAGVLGCSKQYAQYYVTRARKQAA